MPGDDPSAALTAEILRLGRKGSSRREIAAALGMTLEQLATRTRAEPEVAAALALAEEAARAWWEGLPRAAFGAGARVNLAAWRAAMTSRFGAAGLDGAPARPRAIYDIPDNGMNRRQMPDWWEPEDLDDAEHMFRLWALCAQRANRRRAEAKALFVGFGGVAYDVEKDFADDFEDEEEDFDDQGD
jgi:hypothetical protein